MKIRLSQSKCGSTVDRTLHLSDELFLRPFHLGGALHGRIVEPVEVKKTVRDVETQFLIQGRAETTSLTFRGLGADEYLSVLEGNDVRRTALVQKSPMDRRYSLVGEQDDVYLGKPGEHAPLSPRQGQALCHGAFREFAQNFQIDAEQPLPIRHGNARECLLSGHVSGRDSAWKFRVIKRAPLLNVK